METIGELYEEKKYLKNEINKINTEIHMINSSLNNNEEYQLEVIFNLSRVLRLTKSDLLGVELKIFEYEKTRIEWLEHARDNLVKENEVLRKLIKEGI